MAYVFNEFQLKWLDALESEKYKQGKYNLKNLNDEYCCLGVGCELLNLKSVINTYNSYYFQENKENYSSYAPPILQKTLKLIDKEGSIKYSRNSLSQANDNGKSFKEIAKFCRENPEKVFLP